MLIKTVNDIDTRRSDFLVTITLMFTMLHLDLLSLLWKGNNPSRIYTQNYMDHRLHIQAN